MNDTVGPGAYREFSAINPEQYDAARLLSNYDAMTQAQILSSLREIQQSSATSTAVRQNAARILANNTPPTSMYIHVGDSAPTPSDDRKPHAALHSCRNDKVESRTIHKMGRVGKFPLKLHALLKDLKEQGRSDIAAFLPHGRAFVIFNTAEFAKSIMPLHFRMSRYSSFQRQLNLYDFQRITEGPDKGAYHVRHYLHLCCVISFS
jgi:hypothetical protein